MRFICTFWRRWFVGVVFAAVLLTTGVGCWQAVSTAKVPTGKDSSGNPEELPPPKRDPG